MKTLFLVLLTIVGAIVAVSVVPDFVGGIFGIVVGALGLVFGAVVAVGATALGLIVGAVGACAGICLACLPVLILLGVLALPFVAIALLVRALA